MAITSKGIELMSRMNKPKKIVSFGYPIILTPPDVIEKLFQVDLDSDDMMSQTHSQRIRKVHGTSKPYFVAIDKLYKKLGATFHAIDILQIYGCEKIHDLNNDFPEYLISEVGNADLCIDPGTLEHVFYAGKAFISLYNLCKVNGYILHISAPIAPNHGLWNPQEKLFLKFYGANNAEILVAEKYFTSLPNQPEVFTGKRWKLDRASELRSTVFVKKTNDNEIVLPKDYLT